MQQSAAIKTSNIYITWQLHWWKEKDSVNLGMFSQIHWYIASGCTTCSNKPFWIFGISRPIWNLKLFGIFLDRFMNSSCSSDPALSCRGSIVQGAGNLASQNSVLKMASYSWRQCSDYKSLKARCMPELSVALLASISWLKHTTHWFVSESSVTTFVQ